MIRCATVLSLKNTLFDYFMESVNSWEEVNKFGGKNRTTARVALKEMRKGTSQTFDMGFLLLDVESKYVSSFNHSLLALASSYHTYTTLHITYMASKETGKGYGRKLLLEICKYADKFGQSVELTAVETAKDFYSHMGMFPSPNVPGAFRFNRETIGQFIENAEEFNYYGA